MTYLPVKDIAKQFWISKRTIYNYLSKYPSKIRNRKEFWKTLVHLNDFEAILNHSLQSRSKLDNTPIESNANQKVSTPVWTLNPNFESLQNDFKTLSTSHEHLQKEHSNLKDHSNKLVVFLNEAKAEKKVLQDKYDTLEEQYQMEYKGRAMDRVKFMVVLFLVVLGFLISGFLVWVKWM